MKKNKVSSDCHYLQRRTQEEVIGRMPVKTEDDALNEEGGHMTNGKTNPGESRADTTGSGHRKSKVS